jgi:ANTAR domain/GAF domain
MTREGFSREPASVAVTEAIVVSIPMSGPQSLSARDEASTAPVLDPREFARLADALHDAPSASRTAEQVLSFAVQQLDADHGGIVLLRRGRRLDTIAATDPLVACADGFQCDLDEGPCREPVQHGEAILVADLRADQRWPRWGPKVADLGVTSLMTIHFSNYEGRSAGSINLYWRQPREFLADDIAFTDVFARHAALALSASLEIAGLNVALDGRKLIGQAQGILMGRHDLTASQAFEVLRRYSQDHNMKLRVVAEYLVATRSLPPDRPLAATEYAKRSRSALGLTKR